MDLCYAYFLNQILEIIRYSWFTLIIGTLIGAIFSFLITSYFSDNLTNIFKTSKSIPYGCRNLLTFARSEPFVLVEWKLNIGLATRFRSPRAELSLMWEDALGGKQFWRYRGLAHRKATFSTITMTLASDKKSLAAHPGARSPSMIEDTCIIMLGNDTENWPIRPCLISSFDEFGNCFASLGVLKPSDLSAESDAEIKSLEPLLEYLDYRGLRDKLSLMTRASKD